MAEIPQTEDRDRAIAVTVKLTPQLYSRLILAAHRHEQELGDAIREGLQTFVDSQTSAEVSEAECHESAR